MNVADLLVKMVDDIKRLKGKGKLSLCTQEGSMEIVEAYLEEPIARASFQEPEGFAE